MTRAFTIFTVVALLYAGSGLLPGRTFAPLDIPLDFDAWKSDPAQRVRVSNSLLADVVVQFVPWDREIRRMAARGEFPWTNRFAGEGGPLFANPQTVLFSPFTWPRLLFGLYGWALMALLKIVAGAACMYWFARELEIEERQAIFSGIVFATAGYSTVWLLYPITHVFALIPGLAAASLRLMKFPSGRNAALVVLFAALCTAGGHPETLFVSVIGIWIFLVWEAERRPDFGLLAIIPSSVGALLGFLLLSFQTVPFLTILSDGYAGVLRPSLPHGFRPWAVLSQVLPGVLGSPLRGELDLTAVPNVENFNLRTGGFIGALVLLALAASFRELSPALKRGLAIGGAALVISWIPPGVWLVARHLPVVRLLTLEYFALLFVLFGSVAAGPALAIVARKRLRKTGLAVAVVGGFALAGGLLPLVPQLRAPLTSVAWSGIDALRARGHLRQPREVYQQRLTHYLNAAGLTTARRLALPGLCWAGAGLALCFARRRAAAVLALAATGELLAFGVGFNPAVRMTDVPAPPETVKALQRLDPQRQHLIATHFEVFPANLGTLYGVRDAISYDVLTTSRRVTQLLPLGYDPLLHTFNPILAPDEVRALGGIGVRYVLSRHDVAGAQRVAGPPAPAVGVYEVPDAVPVAMPANAPPPGLWAGIILSCIALLAALAWLRMYALPV